MLQIFRFFYKKIKSYKPWLGLQPDMQTVARLHDP